MSWYAAQLARAFPNATQHELDWCISLTRGYTQIHAAAYLHHEPQIWPDPTRSDIGRNLLAVRDLIDDIKENGIACDL